MVRPVTCPVCGKPVPPATQEGNSAAPFCSDRCKQIDFFRWTDGRYAIVEQLDPARLAETMRGDVDLDSEPEE